MASRQGAPRGHYRWWISIHFTSQCLAWCGVDIVIGVCLSQDLPRGGWTSAASEVLSHEITDLIKSSPSPSPFPHLPLYVTFSLSSLLLHLFPPSVPSSSTLPPPIHHIHFYSLLFSPWLSFLASLTTPTPSSHLPTLLSSPASRS